MALDPNINTLEKQKFRGDSPDNVYVAVGLTGDTGILQGVEWDDVQAAYPSATEEIYSYYLNSTLVAQIEVTYTDSVKEFLLRARRL
jgi:hypothetical protein